MALRRWHLFNITLNKSGYQVLIDGNQVFQNTSSEFARWIGSGTVALQAGDYDGWLRDLVVRNIQSTNPPVTPPPTTNSTVVPTFLPIPSDPDGNFQLRINNSTNIPFVVEASTDLVQWYPIYTHYFAGILEYIDMVSPYYKTATTGRDL